MQKSMDMLNGSLWDKILKFSMPVAATAILEQFFTATDVVIAGNFANSDRTAAMAAVGTDLPIIGMIIFLFLGLALGSNVVIAQSIGRRDTEGVKKAVHTAVLLSLIIGIAVAVFAQFAVVPILDLLEIPAEVLPSAVMYLRIYFLGMPIILLYNFEAAIFRSIGETQKPLMALIAASLVNIVLDLFFVCVCKLDVTGVAIATVLANAVSALILLRLLLKTDSIIKLEWSKLHLDMPTLNKHRLACRHPRRSFQLGECCYSGGYQQPGNRGHCCLQCFTDSGNGSIQYLQLLYTGVYDLCRAELWRQTDGTLSQDFTLMPAGGCYLYRLLYAYRIYLRRQAYCAHQ